MARPDRVLFILLVWLTLATGCSGLLQNIGARWATHKISAVFDLDEAQQMATRAAVDRAIVSAPQVLGPRLDLLVATVDRGLSKGLNEENMLVIERQVDILMDKAVRWIVDEAAPILATLRDEQIDHAQRELDERLQETRDELNAPEDQRLRNRQEKFVDAIENWTGRLSEARRADGRKTLFFVYELLDAEQRDHMSERLHEMHETVKRLLGTAGE